MMRIGVDIGGTNVLAGLVDDAGRIVARVRRDTDAARPDQIEIAVASAVRELSLDHDVEAVGVAAAGFVSPDRRTLLFAPNIAWRHHPLAERIEGLIGRPVVVENDANAAAWAEYRFGRGQGADYMVMITLGTGLGGAFIADGRLIRGAFGAAAELGHMKLVPHGHYCGCGQEGCWEAYVSGTALGRLARNTAVSDPAGAARIIDQAAGGAISGVHVTAAALQGDPVAIGMLKRLGEYLGRGIATLAAVVDPDLVVVGGGLASAAGDFFLPSAREAFTKVLSGRGHRGEPVITTAALGNYAGIVGAADLARPIAELGR